MNIVVSSWPASGGSTISLALSYILKYKYYYAGGVLKYLSRNFGDGQYGGDLTRFEEVVGEKWDDLWEAYREIVLSKSDKAIFDAKTAGFLQEDKSNLFSVMLTADKEARFARTQSDKRGETPAELELRDKELTDRWQRKFGINIYDKNLIESNYDLMIDTSNLTIESELMHILDSLSQNIDISFNQEDKVKELMELLSTKGKEGMKNALSEQGLIKTSESIIHDWKEMIEIRTHVERMPNDIRDFIMNL